MIKYLHSNPGLMASKLPDHAHCGNCGDPVQFGTSYCSGECEREHTIEVAKEKRLEYISYALVGVILVAVTAITYFLS